MSIITIDPSIDVTANDTASHVEATKRDIATLKIEQRRLQELADSQRLLMPRLQQATARAITSPGEGNTEAVRQLENDLERAVQATATLGLIRQQITDLEKTLYELEGRARREQCQDVRRRFEQKFDHYRQQSKDLMATYRELQQLSQSYSLMTGTTSPLLDVMQASLNLPAINRDGNFIATGRQ